MQIAVDEQGLEWWEKLPAERQDRVPVPLPTAAQIEDAHWQLVPHANWAAEKERLSKPGVKGCLPGDGCHCKVCSLHSGELSPSQTQDGNAAHFRCFVVAYLHTCGILSSQWT